MRLLPYDYAVRNLGRSPVRLAATVGGSALVVLLIISAVAFVQGMRRSLSVHMNNRNILLVSTGSEESLERSQISAAVPGQVRAGLRGIRSRLDQAYLSPEVHIALFASRQAEHQEELRAFVRGVTPAAFLVHDRVRLNAGRLPRAGHNELLIGARTADKLNIPDADLGIGKVLYFEKQRWEIVGRIHAPGTVIDAEIWTALSDLQVATRRDTLSCVVITLEQAEPPDVAAWTATRLDLELSAMTEAEYYASLRRFYRPIRIMIMVTAVLMSLAGLLGGLNTLYAAFAVRSRETGMLQALGYSHWAVFVCLLQEAVLAALGGALLACAAALLFLHGQAVRFSMGVFELQVDAVTLAAGLGCGLLIGLIGAVPPAIRCLHLPIPEALKGK